MRRKPLATVLVLTAAVGVTVLGSAPASAATRSGSSVAGSPTTNRGWSTGSNRGWGSDRPDTVRFLGG